MKTLIWKELRENFKLAVLGFLAFTLLVLATWHNYSQTIENVLRGNHSGDFFTNLQPLSSSVFTASVGLFCALFGLLLGWTQIFHERHRDLWAYLVHRPICRTDIFLGKIAGGLGIYCVAAGLPLGGFMLWAAIPGHVAAPFEWQLLHPFMAHFLAGMAYYLAGMLIGLRQARWYGSRGLGIGAALLASALIIGASESWQILFAIILALGVLGFAVWGAFHSHGSYRGQPALGKAGLALSLGAGALVVLFVCAGLLANFIPGLSSSVIYPYYAMTKDGRIFKQISGMHNEMQVVDLEGAPPKDPKTGKPMTITEFQKLLPPRSSVLVQGEGGRKHRHASDFTFWRVSSGTLWFTWRKYDRIIGYDVATRQPMGSLGPEGFARDLRGDGSRFLSHAMENPWTPAELFNTDTQVFQVDAEERKVTSIFTTSAADPVRGTAEIKIRNTERDYSLVLTKQAANLLSATGAVVWRVPFEASRDEDAMVELAVLEPPGTFALWSGPGYTLGAKARAAIPTRISWIGPRGVVSKSEEVPTLVPNTAGGGPGEKLMGLSMPLAFDAAILWMMEPQQLDVLPASWLSLGLAGALLLWIPLTWWLGRRAGLSVQSLLCWSVFQLAFGLPGLLAFVCAQEWPAREPCPNCKKPRSVEGERCEHCGAEFAPPETTGTEIFETLAIK